MTSYNGASYSWQGRELRKITSGSNTYSYKYDADGIRTSKTVNGTKTEFFLNGSQILAQKTGDTTMLFFYDSAGKRVGFANGDTLYYYLYNVQGDVIAIMRAATGQVVARYSYDAWGKCTVTNASGYTVGEKNPFRYRGYYYDTETGLYYLNSRYYSPEFGRFISADSLIDNRSANSQNLFAYCNNNPVNRYDVNGNWSIPNWLKVTVGAVAIAGLALATACTGGVAAVVCGAALSGAIAGGVSGAGIGAIGGGLSGGWQGALDGACSGFMSGTLIGGATGAVSAGINIATGATTVVGNAHGSTLHKLATNIEAGKMAASGQYSQIGINKSLGKMGLNGGLTRPDIIGIGNNGANKLVEVVSPRQSTTYISNKMSRMLANNTNSVGKIINWVRKLFK